MTPLFYLTQNESMSVTRQASYNPKTRPTKSQHDWNASFLNKSTDNHTLRDVLEIGYLMFNAFHRNTKHGENKFAGP